MTHKFKAGDKITLLTDPGYVDISANRVYTLYETISGLAFRDDVGDERMFAGCDGQVHDWMLLCEIELFNENTKPVMIDARKLLARISNDTTIREAIAYVQGVIDGQEEN